MFPVKKTVAKTKNKRTKINAFLFLQPPINFLYEGCEQIEENIFCIIKR